VAVRNPSNGLIRLDDDLCLFLAISSALAGMVSPCGSVREGWFLVTHHLRFAYPRNVPFSELLMFLMPDRNFEMTVRKSSMCCL
jgi:hypothetical protein